LWHSYARPARSGSSFGYKSKFLRESGAIEDLYSAAYLGRTEQVVHFLAQSPELLYAEHPADYVYRVTPLHYAVSGGHQHTVRWLLSSGAKVAPYSTDLLHFAIYRHDLPLVDLLLEHGADARQVSQFTSANALDARILERLLAAGASILGADESGWPLLVACRGDKGEHPDKARLLLEHGAAVHKRDGHGRTALHYAARAGFARVIAVLLEYGADIEATDMDGRTPLWAALLARLRAALLTLLQAGADPNVGQGPSRQTPLHKAVREKDVSLAALLLQYGADAQRQDAHGRMALPDAFVDRHPELAKSSLGRGPLGEE
jgi:ankyrin repeat protein